MPTNKNAQLRYQILDRCFSNRHRRYTIDDLVEAVNDAKANQGDKPAMIILDTVKGAGVKAIEDTKLNHHLNVGEEALEYIAALKAKLE